MNQVVKFDQDPWIATKYANIWSLTVDPKVSSGAIATWLIYAPWMHPHWNFHWAHLVHLREIEGAPPPTLQFISATHEFAVFALHPEHEPANLDYTKFQWLEPVSICQQFERDSDAEALQLIEDKLQAVGRGEVSVDSDYRSLWEALLR